MVDKNDAPRRPVPESKQGSGGNSPFSIPLEKGMDIMAEPAAFPAAGETAASGKSEDQKREGALRQAAPAKAKPVVVSHYHGPRLWKVLLAMFLFPFFFNLGSELYLLARTAAVARWGGFQTAAMPSRQPSAIKSDSDKVIDSLALVIANQEKIFRDSGQRVVIIHPDYAGVFSYDNEKSKVKELTGIDLDDPVAGSDKFSKIKSSEILSTVIGSFDHILLNASQSNISEFRLKNTLEAKKQALKRLQELR